MTRAPSTPATAAVGVELRLAIDIPSRVPGGDGLTRWVKVTAFGSLAERTAASVGKGDRVTVLADDLLAEAWAANGSGEPRARVSLRAREIAASMAFDILRTGYAARKAAKAAAANGAAQRPARRRAGRGPGHLRRHHQPLTTPREAGAGAAPVPAPRISSPLLLFPSPWKDVPR